MSDLLRSREFWSLVVGVLVSIVVALVPQLAGSKETIITAVMALVGVFIAAINVEKTAAANRSGSTKIERIEAAKVAKSYTLKP